MKTNHKFVCICSAIAAIFFGIVSYGQFFNGKTGMGVMFALLAVSQVILAVINLLKSKK